MTFPEHGSGMSPQEASSPGSAHSSALYVDGLTVEFPIERAWRPVIQDVTFCVSKGRAMGLVGESGSGKSVTASAVLGMTSRLGGRIREGRIILGGDDLTTLSPRQLRKVQGSRMGLIPQNPMRALNPAFTVGEQLAETLRSNCGMSRRDAWRRAVEILDRMRIPRAAERARNFPHEFSGGMCQRVMIGMALACSPDLLVADEPTTALDVTVQASILGLLREVLDEDKISILFISHDLAVVAEICDDVAVMYSGQIVESGAIEQVFATPSHPYTAGLISSIPRRGQKRLRAIPGSVPSPTAWPTGCRFEPRCSFAVREQCGSISPSLESTHKPGHRSRCLRASELELEGVAR